MSASPGWYPAGDGTSRYWDGNQWIENPQPEHASGGATDARVAGVSGEVIGPLPGRTRSVPVSAWLGWGGLLLVAFLGAVSSGVSGLVVLSGSFVAVVAVVALIRGRVGWAHLRSRAAGGAALAGAVALFAVGGATADPQPAPALPAIASASSTSQPAPVPASPSTAAPTTGTSSAAVASKAPAPRPPAPAPAPPKGTALAAVADLAVKGRAAKTGYSRDQFGQAWFDTDRNGCDTRNDILRRDLADKTMKNSCKVLAGTLAPDPYTGVNIRFESGGASEVDIDHVVALGDAWQKGATPWPEGKKLAFANDPLNLLAVDAGANRSKGDGDAATWLPPNKPFCCAYVARQVAVKLKYGLWVTAAERDAMRTVLGTCPTLALPAPASAPTTAQPPATRPAPPQPPDPTVTRPAPRPPAAPAPAPQPQPSPAPGVVVHPGSFCSPVGARGVTIKGTPMVCSVKAGASRARWRSG